MNGIKSSIITRIVDLGKAGLTASAIAKKTGVTVRTVTTYLRDAGVTVRGRGRPPKVQTRSYHSIYSMGYRAGLKAGTTTIVTTAANGNA